MSGAAYQAPVTTSSKWGRSPFELLLIASYLRLVGDEHVRHHPSDVVRILDEINLPADFNYLIEGFRFDRKRSKLQNPAQKHMADSTFRIVKWTVRKMHGRRILGYLCRAYVPICI